MIFRRKFQPEVPALQVKLVGFRILRVGFRLRRRIGTRYCRPQLRSDIAGEITLYGQQIGNLTLVLIAPQLFVVTHID